MIEVGKVYKNKTGESVFIRSGFNNHFQGYTCTNTEHEFYFFDSRGHTLNPHVKEKDLNLDRVYSVAEIIRAEKSTEC